MSPDDLPHCIGPYRVIRLLGDGASGRVVLAEQSSPARQVALKLLRGIATTSDTRLRFAREARLLALLEHPGIARLYAADVAETSSGPQPFLAMEYVPGADLLTHARALPLRDKLALLAAVCKAVHFAHTRGVIHRDLKPANILVDAHGEPKVLDFGIAHVIDPDGETLLTRAGEVLGTLPYMSWEQLGGEAASLDPRSDVFALGVIGYELLAGERPYPQPASASLTAVLEQRRKMQPQRLSLKLPEARGDVETILHKAMSFEARDRYESASDLAGDLQRYLDYRPIEARPLTATYAASRFVRRHRGLSAAMAVAVVSLVAAAVISTRFGLREQAARTAAESRSAELRAVNQFLEDALTTPSPESNTPGSARTLIEVLKNGENVLASDQSVPPLVAAQVLKTIGSTWHGIEDYPRAEAALALAQKRLATVPDGDPARQLLGLEVQALQGVVVAARGDVEAGTALLKKSLAALPPSSGEAQLLRMSVYGRYADLLLGHADFAEVIAMLDGVVKESVQTLGPDHIQTLFNHGRLAYALRLSGDNAGALKMLDEIMPRLQRVFGPDNSMTLLLQNEQALGYLQTGQFKPAEAGFRAVLAADVRLYGEAAQSTTAVRGNLVNTLIQLKAWDEATVLAEKNYALARSKLGADHFDTHMSGRNYARVLEQAGRAAEAEALYQAAIIGIPQAVGPKHPEAFAARNDYVVFLIEQQRVPEAVKLAAAVHEDAVKTFGVEALNTAKWDINYGRALLAHSQPGEARAVLSQALPILEKAFGAEHPRVLKAKARLGEAEAALADKT